MSFKALGKFGREVMPIKETFYSHCFNHFKMVEVKILNEVKTDEVTVNSFKLI
jgi:hypothetical protein